MARKIWRAYLIEPSEAGMRPIVEAIDPQGLTLIGTGRHELYSSSELFFEALERDQAEAQDITFEILDEYYEPQAIGVDSCLVFGTLWVRERSDRPKPMLAEMETRFTLVLRREADRWLIAHLHHSTPNADQRHEEYYPKTVTEQANAALERSKAMEHRAEHDSLTDLFNRIAFENHVASALANGGEDGIFIMIDLDNFKEVNDTLGHPEGDRVIQEFAKELRRVFARDAIIGRMGGDEFGAFIKHRLSQEEAEAKASELVEAWSQRADCQRADGLVAQLGCSAGLARAARGMTFFDLYRAADRALYASKDRGKGSFSW